MIEEMRQHLEELTRVNVESGMSPEEARFAAHRRFGGVSQLEEKCRDEHGFMWVGQLLNDFRFTVRSLRSSKGFTATVLVTLILGIGVSTAVYNLTEASTIFDLPYANAGDLFRIGHSDKRNPALYYCPRFQYQAYRDQINVFSDYAAVLPRLANVTIHGDPVANLLLEVSSDCFGTLGIKPVLGRGFLPGEFRAGANSVVVISDLFWRRYFDASPDALGRQVMIDQVPCTVIGILAPNQPFPTDFACDVYRPIDLSVNPNNVFKHVSLSVIARLKPGVSQEQAIAAMTSVKLPTLSLWASDYISKWKPILGKLTVIERPQHLWVVLAAGAFLYAISCINLVNLMLIRLIGRRRELSIRIAIGGSRFQVIRLLVVESVSLSAAASLVVALLAKFLFPALFAAINGDDSALFRNFWDLGTLSCIAGLSLLACVGAVVVPALGLLKADINPGLKDTGPTIGESRWSGQVRTSLIVLQAAFAVVLLIGTGLMVRSFERLHHLDLGFDPAGKVKVQVEAPSSYDLTPEAWVQLFERLQRRLSTIPGVRGVSFGQDSLFPGYFAGTAELRIEGGKFEQVAGNFVSADFLKTSGLVLKEGRWLSGNRGEVEAVVNESMAKELFGSRDPVGLSFGMKASGDLKFPIVGVVKDARDVIHAPAGIRYYVPNWMSPSNIDTLVLRLDQDPKKEFEAVVKKAIYEIEPRLIVQRVSSINDIVGSSMATERYAFTILKGLAGIAFGLTVVGLFSVVAYSVESRMNEFGVRIALGATSSDLRRLVLSRGLGAASLGLAIGIAAAFGLTRFMESLLFETKPFDPPVYLGVAIILVIASAAACWLPAQRASRVDVVRLLRAD
jgi:putative ABC transport system permease protein